MTKLLKKPRRAPQFLVLATGGALALLAAPGFGQTNPAITY